MPITVLKKEDGFWLCFDCTNGNHAMVNATQLAAEKGPIRGMAILDTCEECYSNTKEQNGRIDRQIA